MSNFHVGQKVVCIADISTGGHGTEKRPVKGSVYTVRNVWFSERYQCELIRLEEITNALMRYEEGLNECGFRSYCFRPLRETSIEIFTDMLVASNVRTPA